MRYDGVVPAVFLSRPNRFIAQVELDGAVWAVHVKNTGRCRELLVPGARVYLAPGGGAGRKTAFDLIAVEKALPGGGRLLINLDAQAPNRVFAESADWLLPDPTLLRPEAPWGNSRFDFYWEAPGARGFVEVKGVTLEREGAALFPDAPTERGVKHLRELIRAREAGFEAAVCFVIQLSPVRFFSPNDETHPAFGAALRDAARAGVKLLAMDCAVTPDSLSIQAPVPICL